MTGLRQLQHLNRAMLGYVAWARGVRPGPARADRGLNALLPSSSLKQESLS